MKKQRSENRRVSEKARQRGLRLADVLRERYPAAHCALEYRNAFELLIATILSAQTTDVAVNKVTLGLFRQFPDARAMAQASPSELEPYLRSIGLFRNKAKSLVGAARMLVEEFDGEVPRTMEELIRLPGVARKTANVVLGNCFGVNEGFVVDTHIQRLAVRYGLANETDNVQVIERKLMALFPRERWCELSHQFIWHGRAVCKARAGLCADDEICSEFGVCCELRTKPGASGNKATSARQAARSAKSGPDR
ncbi:MAG: endonuclease III [Phycisphaeraceae bacterium]|nr:endonuclease III [Phycisphaeraceae bacterium]